MRYQHDGAVTYVNSNTCCRCGTARMRPGMCSYFTRRRSPAYREPPSRGLYTDPSVLLFLCTSHSALGVCFCAFLCTCLHCQHALA